MEIKPMDNVEKCAPDESVYSRSDNWKKRGKGTLRDARETWREKFMCDITTMVLMFLFRDIVRKNKIQLVDARDIFMKNDGARSAG